jgi:hypothetical protein
MRSNEDEVPWVASGNEEGMMVFTRRAVVSAGMGALLGVSAPRPVRGDGPTPGHVVLLGDSIFDNKRYIRADLAVIEQLRKALPAGWKATLLAVDGNVAADIPKQLERLPDDASHLVLSVGGNDALRAARILEVKASNVAEGLLKLADARDEFERSYALALTAALKPGKPLTICTIYDPNYPEAARQRTAVAGLALFNDVIGRAAVRRGLSVLDLRALFTEKTDYANAIEPSAAGGQKIVEQITAIVTGHDFARRQAVWYPKAQT